MPSRIGLLIGLAFIAVLFWQRGNLMGLLRLSMRGKKLTNNPVDSTGKIPVQHSELKANAEKALGRAISDDAFALAKMFASEGPSDSVLKRRARAWVAYNDLQALKKQFGWKNFVKLFTYSNIASQNGFYGLQEKGRRYASWGDVYEGFVTDAESILQEFSNPLLDPTKGATKFVDEKALGKQPGTEGKTIASLEKQWGLKGRRIDNSDFYVFA